MTFADDDDDASFELNMTPMVDIVFLLIIFFMIITDLSQQDLEELKLPMAEAAVEDKPDPNVVRPVINILPTGRMVVKGDTIFAPENQEKNDMKAVELYLFDQRTKMMRGERGKGWDYFDIENGEGPKLPDNPLLLRADQNTPFKHIQKVMELCGKSEIASWRLELAAAQPEADDKEDK